MSEKPIVKVSRIQIKGVEYFKDAKNNLYDTKTKEPMGVWNPETKTIEPFIQFEGSEYEAKQGIWSATFVVSDKQTAETPIEEDDEGNITEWEYSFPIFWNGVIESKTEITNIMDLIPDFPKDYRVGTFTLYTKNILNDDEKISKIDRKWGRSDSNTSWTLDIEGNIQRLINEGELEGKKESEETIAKKLLREEALKRMEETRLARKAEREEKEKIRKAEREEKEKISNPEFIESKILELQEALKTETLPDKLKIINKLLKGLEKRLAVATKEKLDREEYQLKTFGSKEQQEEQRQKEKEDLEALKKKNLKTKKQKQPEKKIRRKKKNNKYY